VLSVCYQVLTLCTIRCQKRVLSSVNTVYDQVLKMGKSVVA
jgi:hypothetical protein